MEQDCTGVMGMWAGARGGGRVEQTEGVTMVVVVMVVVGGGSR